MVGLGFNTEAGDNKSGKAIIINRELCSILFLDSSNGMIID